MKNLNNSRESKKMDINLREMMEAIDDIQNSTDGDFEQHDMDIDSTDEAEDTPDSLTSIKEIVKSLKDLSQKFVDGNAPDGVDSVLSQIKDSLKDLVGDVDVDDEIDECYGTDGMEPTVTKDGVPDYDEAGAPSYAAREGFVG